MITLDTLDVRLNIEQLRHNGVRFLVATIHPDDYSAEVGNAVERTLRSFGFAIVHRQREQVCLLRDDYQPSAEYVRLRDLN